ncbi:NfeD family protein [Actinomycetospora sp. TBRC 11914]|uniref:NfeD family protein n=1 Tax=Actinomycetospora sp. TBRC 11914 TaxID=2729387 RepID=UPI00145E7529|nr:NfeD family protein [Actinomycetospora sp. TBRC 11914]NMO92770.1 NfeD family protein [Actinomycetospora sp. TBRC 11914]
MIPLIWAIAGVVLVVAEVLTGGLVLLMLGAAALGTAAVAAAGAPLGPDLAVFALLAGLFVLVARPAVRRRMQIHDPVNTGTRGLLGSRGEVVEPVGVGAGTVRLAGSLWSARSLHEDDLPAGTPVVVVEISGATAVVTATGSVNPVEE